MSKYCGMVGYVITEEQIIDGQPTGVWTDRVEEHLYYGDIIRPMTRWSTSDKVNDDLTVSNNISILADEYSYTHFSSIKYVKWMGVKWKVTSIEVQRPRLILTLGGEYNG